MLQHPDLLYRVHRLRHQELIAEADRFRLVNHRAGSRARRTSVHCLVRRAAALARTLYHRDAAERGVRPRFDDGPAKSAP